MCKHCTMSKPPATVLLNASDKTGFGKTHVLTVRRNYQFPFYLMSILVQTSVSVLLSVISQPWSSPLGSGFLHSAVRFLVAYLLAVFETEPLFVVQAGLELSTLLPLHPGAGVTGMNHHAWLCLMYWNLSALTPM